MTEPELTDLLELIDARIDEKIEEAFGRGALHEVIRFTGLRDTFINAWIEEAPDA